MFVEIVTAGARVARAVELAGRVAAAPQSTPLLVSGASGTGKDLIARLVHEKSGAAGALVTIDCAALPEALLESDLFGHERGAFTGATEARAGRLEAARGGTLVFDEVAALAPQAQAKLLRVVEERRFRRLGGDREIALRARVVALTNVDLRAAVAAGDFRRDLYYRLNGVAIEMPRLRDEPEAIGPLAELFARRLGRAAAAADGPSAFVTRRALKLLEGYAFPGNARELRNIVERALVSGASRLDVEHLPPEVTAPTASPGARRPTLAEVEEAYICEVLDEARGNKARAARALGISRKNLYERLARMARSSDSSVGTAGEPED